MASIFDNTSVAMPPAMQSRLSGIAGSNIFTNDSGGITNAINSVVGAAAAAPTSADQIQALLSTGDEGYTGRTRHVQTTLLVHPAANGGYIVGCGGKLYTCARIEDITGVLATVLGEAALNGKG